MSLQRRSRTEFSDKYARVADASGAHRLAAFHYSRSYAKKPHNYPADFSDFTTAHLNSSIFNQSHGMAIDTALPGLIQCDLRHKKPGISFTETAQMRIMTTTAKMIC